jgi:nucleotide-binding universal stress UspA family protein
MRTIGDSAPVSDEMTSNGADTQTQPAFRRVLVPVEDAGQVEHVVELARRAGATEARVLHLNLFENIGGRRFAVETAPKASGAVEAAVLELSLAGIGASGVVRRTLVDRAAEAIVAEAAEWGADLIVLGTPRRREFATRLFGSVTLRVLLHAPCPVIVAPPAGSDRPHHAERSATPVTA